MGKSKRTEGRPSNFSGHETFPVRQLWLKKAFEQSVGRVIPKSAFADENAIATFGVGKNMVAAIRHWALACDVMRETSTGYAVMETAIAIFHDDGLDPYSENPNTAWYAHWWLAGKGNRATTWNWLFNHVTSPIFSREDLEAPLADYARGLNANRMLSPATLSRDIETCD